MRRGTRRLWLSAMLIAAAPAARAQFTLPTTANETPDARSVFLNQCGTCHSATRGDTPRQGPNLAGVFGRKAGTQAGYHYSASFAKADFAWDEAHLDAWLTHPQDIVPGATMLYRQRDPTIRKSIIDWLREQH